MPAKQPEGVTDISDTALPASPRELDLESEGPLRGAVARGGLWSLGGTGAVLLATLVATPFTIRLLGPASYGLWSLLQATLSYLVLADLGMASASTKFAGDRRARSDGPGEAAVIWTSLALTVAVTCAAVVVLSIAAPFILSTILHVPPHLRTPGILAVRIVGAAVVARSVAGTINTPQVVRLRWRGLTLATSGPTIVQVVAAPLALAATAGGVVAMSVVAAGAALLAVVGNGLLAVRLQPGLLHPRFDRRLVLPLVRYGGALTLSGFAAIPLTTAERFLLASSRSTTAVAYYGVAMALATILAAIPAAATAPLFPALVRLHATGANDELHRLHRQALQGIFLVMTPSALLLGFLAGPFLRLWAGPEYAQYSTLPFFVILAGLWFNALAYVPYNYLLASGRTSVIAKIHLAELVPYLVAAAVLTATLGVVGAAIAWASRVVLDSVLFFAVAKHDAGLAWLPTPSRPLLSLVAAAGLAVGVLVLATITGSLAVRAGCAVGLLLAYGFSMWRLVLTPGEREGARVLATELFPLGRRVHG